MGMFLPVLGVPGLFGGGGVPLTLIDTLTAWWPMSEASGQRWNSFDDSNHALDTGTVGTANSHADFVAANSDYMIVPDSATLGLGADTAFTWTIKFKPDSVTGVHFLFAKLDSGANNKFYEYGVYTSGTEISFRIGNGTTFETVSTSGANLQIGTSYQVTVGHDPDNNLISIKLDSADPVTRAWTGGTYDGSDDLAFGRPGEFSGSYYDGELWDAGFWNGRYLTADEQADLVGQTYPFGLAAYQITTLDPDTLSNQYSRHDTSDVSTMWQDTGKTTAVASNDDPIRVIESSWNSHDWVATNDTVRPLFKTNVQNSLGVALFDGVDTNVDLDAPTPPDGDFTWFIVAKNSDDTDGSHIGENAWYIAITGASYDATSPRVAMHTATNKSAGASWKTIDPTNIFVLIEITRSGDTFTVDVLGQGGGSVDDAAGFNVDRIGEHYPSSPTFDNWHFLGYYGESILVTSALDAKTKARVRYFLADKWGISGVKYAPYVTT